MLAEVGEDEVTPEFFFLYVQRKRNDDARIVFGKQRKILPYLCSVYVVQRQRAPCSVSETLAKSFSKDKFDYY
jgi:hypothetical protein